MNPSDGFIFDIYRGTTHDGPGMRTTVFLKGCPLNCVWCHNPESISAKNRVWWEKIKCIGCGECQKACGNEACTFGENGVEISEEKCVLCGKCVKACPAKAIFFVGKSISVTEAFKEVEKYKDYYKTYGGGVTLSGGEPLLQSDFVKELFSICKENGIHTALDTCGNVSFDKFASVLPYTDCLLYDIKLIDSNEHKKYTGQGNALILENLLKIAKGIREGKFNCEIWIRTPLIPGITDKDENIRNIAVFIKEHLDDVVTRFEMCTFNKACINKYEKLGLSWQCNNLPLITASDAERIKNTVKNIGIKEEKTVISGITAE